MHRSNGWTVLFLIILLGVLGLDMFQVGRLGSEVQSLKDQVAAQAQQIGDLISVRSQVTSMQNEMRELAEAQSWASGLEVSAIGYDERFLGVKLSWRLKEYTQGSAVTLYWQEPGTSEFKPLEANLVGETGFEALTEVPLAVAPVITVVQQKDSSKQSQKKDHGVTAPAPSTLLVMEPELVRGQTYRYYICMKAGNQVRSTEVKTVDLSKLPVSVTADLRVRLHDQGSKGVTVRVSEELGTVLFARYRLEHVTLEGVRDDAAVFTKELPVVATLEVGGEGGAAAGTGTGTGAGTSPGTGIGEPGSGELGGTGVPVFETVLGPEEAKVDSVWLVAEFEGGRSVRRALSMQF